MAKRDTEALRCIVLDLERLVTELEADPEYIPSCCGLCTALNSLSGLDVARYLVRVAGLSWPQRYRGLGSKCVRSVAFPVGGDSEYYRHRDSGSLWLGEQRAMRISLAKHVLSWIWFNRVEALRVLRGG